MAEIRHLVEIDAPAKTVYRALMSQAGLAGWWTTETTVEHGDECAAGSTVEFRFGDRYHNRMRVVGLDEDRRVAWECLMGDAEWVGTTFTFDLEARGERTVLRFAHGNWREATDFFANCNYHWGFYMRSLKLYCETGRGEPFGGEG